MSLTRMRELLAGSGYEIGNGGESEASATESKHILHMDDRLKAHTK